MHLLQLLASQAHPALPLMRAADVYELTIRAGAMWLSFRVSPLFLRHLAAAIHDGALRVEGCPEPEALERIATLMEAGRHEVMELGATPGDDPRRSASAG